MAMAASGQFRPQNRDLGMVMREVDEDLAIFLGIRNGEKDMNDPLLVEESDVFDDSKSGEQRGDSLLAMNASQAETCLAAADDNFLNLEMEIEESDNNWFLTQTDASLLPAAEVDARDFATRQTEIPNGEVISLNPKLQNTSEQPHASLSDSSSKLATLSNDRKPTHRAPTPTRRPSLPATAKPSRPSTPTSRPTLLSSKPVSSQSRSSNPVGPALRSSTPSSRPYVPIASKSTPRSSTPTRKPTTPTLSASDRSSSVRKTGTATSKSSGPLSRGTSPTVKSRLLKPSEMLSLCHDATQNPKASVPKRPVSASRGRMNVPEKPRQKSCSPPKVRAPISSVPYKPGCKMLYKSRNGDEVNPVVMGTKMVDRVVNMRKLAPPKQDDYVCHDNARKSSQENLGFGRSLSKKSLDMAIRHMDIGRSIRDKMRTTSASSCGKGSNGNSGSPGT